MLVLAGPKAAETLARAFRPRRGWSETAAGALRLGHLIDGERVLDEAIAAQGGDVAEISIHGGPAAAAAALHLLSRLGAEPLPAPPAAPECFGPAHPRWANPAVGEEMLASLHAAGSALAVKALSQQWSAGLSRLVREALAGPLDPSVAAGLLAAAERLPQMQRLLHPAEVVLAGPPNVGKSTLANALVGREVSLVHDAAGTTRDWVREPAVLAGVPVWLTDTAGLWQPPEGIDAEAVRRARGRIAGADLALLLSAGSTPPLPAWITGPSLRVRSKCDLYPACDPHDAAVSALTGQGLDDLARRVVAALGLDGFDPAAPAAFTKRQHDLLIQAAEAAEAGRSEAAGSFLTVLLAG